MHIERRPRQDQMSMERMWKISHTWVQYGPRERVHAGPRVRGRGFEGPRARD